MPRSRVAPAPRTVEEIADVDALPGVYDLIDEAALAPLVMRQELTRPR